MLAVAHKVSEHALFRPFLGPHQDRLLQSETVPSKEIVMENPVTPSSTYPIPYSNVRHTQTDPQSLPHPTHSAPWAAGRKE